MADNLRIIIVLSVGFSPDTSPLISKGLSLGVRVCAVKGHQVLDEFPSQ